MGWVVVEVCDVLEIIVVLIRVLVVEWIIDIEKVEIGMICNSFISGG